MDTQKTLAQFLAVASVARDNCERAGNVEQAERWAARIATACEILPSGSGFDAGTEFHGLLGNSSDTSVRALMFGTSYHHMNENGFSRRTTTGAMSSYVGWSEWTIHVYPDWQGIDVRVECDGAVLDGIDVEDPERVRITWLIGSQSNPCHEEYIGEVMHDALTTTVDADGRRAI